MDERVERKGRTCIGDNSKKDSGNGPKIFRKGKDFFLEIAKIA